MKTPMQVARDLFFRLTGEIPDDGQTDRDWLAEVERVIEARDAEWRWPPASVYCKCGLREAEHGGLSDDHAFTPEDAPATPEVP